MNFSSLAKKVMAFKKTEKYKEVKRRLKDFDFSSKHNKMWFSELCFCLLTANASAESGIRVQKALGLSVCDLPQKKLSKRLKELKYRFPNKRAEYIHEARKCLNAGDIISKMPSKQARELLVDNIKGLGMKEASHFLRNTGRTDVAIIDRHILRSMGYRVESINKKKYKELELKLAQLARLTDTTLAELDLILWAMQTGKVLK